MEIAKAFDLLLGTAFLRHDWCVESIEWDRESPERARKKAEESLERARKKEEEKQQMRDDSQRQQETAAQREDILLLTNQRLLQCAFDPVCEKKILAGVDQCEKTEQGNYVESCIRAIKVSP